MTDDEINFLTQQISNKENEIEALRDELTEIYRIRRATCKHPNLESTPYEFYCPDCKYYKERSF